ISGPPVLLRLTQTRIVGGASETEHTAVAEKPVLPAAPAGGTTCTAAPSRLIASRNSFGSTGATGAGARASQARALGCAGRWSIQLMWSSNHIAARGAAVMGLWAR